jgi:hypothetical protein
MNCPKCNSSNKPSASYCLQCGFRLAKSGSTAVPEAPSGGRSDGRKKTMVMTPASNPLTDAPVRKKTEVLTPEKRTPATPAVPAAPSGRKPAAKTTFFGPGQNPLAGGGPAPKAIDRRKLRGFAATFDFDPLGHSFLLTEGRNVLGRDPVECSIVLDKDPTVSRRHAVIMARPGQVYVKDQDSEYGTRVNGQEIGMEGKALNDGDTLTLCGYSLTIKLL